MMWLVDEVLWVQIRTLKGHTNEKNFVGLSVNSEYIACGSETNEVFVYHKVTFLFHFMSLCKAGQGIPCHSIFWGCKFRQLYVVPCSHV